jgi:hypothetical protein
MHRKYEVTISDAVCVDGSEPSAAISFAFESHDDLNAILQLVSSRNLFESDDAKAFCVGLKLLGGVLLKHRDADLFQQFAPAFGGFMKTLKAAAVPAEMANRRRRNGLMKESVRTPCSDARSHRAFSPLADDQATRRGLVCARSARRPQALASSLSLTQLVPVEIPACCYDAAVAIAHKQFQQVWR